MEHELWRSEPMRMALAKRDIANVYKLLQRYGVSQRRIAAYTGQSQSEISEILTTGRRVVSYDVLLRIARGLLIPRGRMGLAYDDETADIVGPSADVDVVEMMEQEYLSPIVPSPPREVDDGYYRRRTIFGNTGIRFYFRAPLPATGDDVVPSTRAVRPVP